MTRFDIKEVDELQPAREGEVYFDKARGLVYLRIGVQGFLLSPDCGAVMGGHLVDASLAKGDDVRRQRLRSLMGHELQGEMCPHCDCVRIPRPDRDNLPVPCCSHACDR